MLLVPGPNAPAGALPQVLFSTGASTAPLFAPPVDLQVRAFDYEAYEVAEPVSRMVVDVDRGHLEVIGADIDTVQVERHSDGWEGNLELETRVVDAGVGGRGRIACD